MIDRPARGNQAQDAQPKEVRTRGLDASDGVAAATLIIGVTIVRLFALFRTPLNLYPDEAQYWLWSRTLDFGYYSKPPMIAWAIWLTTGLGGDGEAWVRLSAPLFQAGAAAMVFLIGRRLYGGAAALAAATLYVLAPAIQLSGLVMATDAPLLFFTGAAVLAYVHLQAPQARRRWPSALAMGAALGLAFLSKYAAVYLLMGLVLHAALSREARRAWTIPALAAAVLAFGAVIAPNVAWNAAHHFATVEHTASNANWRGGLFHPLELAEFLLSQVVIFGPIPAGALIAGAVLAVRKRAARRAATSSAPPGDLLLLCFILPPLAIVSLEALISRANANWAGIAYLPAAVLAGAWLIRWRAKRWMTAALVTQALIAVVFLACAISPPTADRLGLSNSFKRAKGWDQMARLVVQRAQAEEPAGLDAVAVNTRFLYYALAYYGRDYFRDPTSPPLKAWLLSGKAENQAELDAPLTRGRRVLAAVGEEHWRDEMIGDFAQVSGMEITRVRLDRKRSRRLDLFVAEGFRPAPRDPATGRPVPRPARPPVSGSPAP